MFEPSKWSSVKQLVVSTSVTLFRIKKNAQFPELHWNGISNADFRDKLQVEVSEENEENNWTVEEQN